MIVLASRELQFAPDQASSFAAQVDALFFAQVAISVGVSLVLVCVWIAFATRFRRGRQPQPGTLHGSLALELTWSAVPLAVFMAMFAWGAVIYVDEFTPPADAMEIAVVGKQWMWKIQHPAGPREINELHVPLGVPVVLTMTSEDVIHSFFIPAFRVKADVLPGRYTQMWFLATKAGTYHLFCTEYCGTKHAEMIGKVIVMPREDYARWLSGEAGTEVPPAVAGEKLFGQLGCATCHRDDSDAIAPRLAGLFGRTVRFDDDRTTVADAGYLRESIRNPGARVVHGYKPLMPTYAPSQLSEEDLLRLIAYLRTLQAPAK